MTKAELVEAVHSKIDGPARISKRDSSELVELVFDTIKETLVEEGKVKISGFGNFSVREKKARIGRNPQTGTELTIPPMRVLTFKASQVLKTDLNKAVN